MSSNRVSTNCDECKKPLDKPERLKPSSIQEEKVRTGKLGRKSGEGYYRYQ